MTRRSWHLGTPLRLDGRGRTAWATDEDYLRGLVETVLFTRPGERLNRPDFGSGVHALVFAPSGDELAQATRALVHGSLQRWLGDLLRVEDVTVEAVEATLTVTISYLPLAAGPAASRRVLTVTGPAGAGP
jgi:phage baseplate assembly protein W